MSLSLHTMSHPSNKKPRVRRGRGDAAAGSYSGRGIKGQKARSGVSGLREMALRRSIQQFPKNRGFKPRTNKPEAVTIGEINNAFAEGSKVNPTTLKSKGLIKKADRVKILNKGILLKKISVIHCSVTAGATAAIEKVGGTVA